MTRVDRHAAERLLSEAREALEELREITSLERDRVLSDRTLVFSMRYSIILVVESLADLAFAILERDYGVCPESYRDAFARLGRKGVVRPSIAEGMERLASLRNLIVHRYWEVDDGRIYDEAVGGGMKVIEKFMREVEGYVETEDP